MESEDFLEMSELENLLESSEKVYFYGSMDFDSFLPQLNNAAVCLSPHLSDEQEETIKSVNIKRTIQKTQNNCKRKNPDLTSKVGTLTYEERQIKINRYREKKKKRVWSKKINYNCRKKVAENRLRIKGRFVTKEQAVVLRKLHETFEAVE